MFNQQTRTFYDNNELQIRKIVQEKPLRYVTNDLAPTYKGPHYTNTNYNINIANDLREIPSRLNYFNRDIYNPDDPSNEPYGNTLLYKNVNTESNLILNGEMCNKEKYYTDPINSYQNIYKMETQINQIKPISIRSENRNQYVCR